MPAREVVELGDLVEAELDVHHGHRELGGVDDAALERRIDVGRRQQLRRDAELLHHLGAEAEEAHLQALQLLERFDLLAEPAGGLGADAEAVDGNEAMLGVDLVAQLVAAAEPFPGQELAEAGAERHRGEEGQRGIFAGVIAGRRPARLDRSFGDRIEALERRNERAGLEELHLELAAGHALDVLGEAHPGRAKVRERAAEGALHLPVDFGRFLRNGGGDRRGEGERHQRRVQRLACFHNSSSHFDRPGPRASPGFSSCCSRVSSRAGYRGNHNSPAGYFTAGVGSGRPANHAAMQHRARTAARPAVCRLRLHLDALVQPGDLPGIVRRAAREELVAQDRAPPPAWQMWTEDARREHHPRGAVHALLLIGGERGVVVVAVARPPRRPAPRRPRSPCTRPARGTAASGCAASPSSVTLPLVQLVTGSRSCKTQFRSREIYRSMSRTRGAHWEKVSSSSSGSPGLRFAALEALAFDRRHVVHHRPPAQAVLHEVQVVADVDRPSSRGGCDR